MTEIRFQNNVNKIGSFSIRLVYTNAHNTFVEWKAIICCSTDEKLAGTFILRMMVSARNVMVCLKICIIFGGKIARPYVNRTEHENATRIVGEI